MQTGGEQFYFGLVATQADQQKTIPALSPDREQFLEYDVSELVYGVQQLDKKKLGLITSLPLQGVQGNPMMGQQGTEGQYVINEWQDTFDVQAVEAGATELPPKLDALAIVHPENLTPRLQFAIDQFLLSGKPVFIAVDPSSEYFKRQAGQMAMFSGGPQPNVSSDLPLLFAAWGIGYNPQKIVGDNARATELQNSANGSVAALPHLAQPHQGGPEREGASHGAACNDPVSWSREASRSRPAARSRSPRCPDLARRRAKSTPPPCRWPSRTISRARSPRPERRRSRP